MFTYERRRYDAPLNRLRRRRSSSALPQELHQVSRSFSTDTPTRFSSNTPWPVFLCTTLTIQHLTSYLLESLAQSLQCNKSRQCPMTRSLFRGFPFDFRTALAKFNSENLSNLQHNLLI